jgi:nucleotide-binding universal stress UspA family protein
VEVCKAFKARLLLHHNVAAVQPGMTRAWEWNEVHKGDGLSNARAEARLREIMEGLGNGIAVRGSISSGPLGAVLLELAQQLPADLLVLGSHGWSTEDHASVTERLIDRSPCPVLTVHDGVEVDRFHLPTEPAEEGGSVPVVVPTDLSESAQHAVNYTFGMARLVPLQVHLLHVVPRGTGFLQTEAVEQRLRSLIPPDFANRAQCHVEHGDAADAIIDASHGLEARCIIMGEHTRNLFRRFLTKDTAREVMHRAPCPVWFVPARG